MKRTETDKLHAVWQHSKEILTKERTHLDALQYNEFVASLFCPGPFCYFVIDFYDMGIVSHSQNLKELIGIDNEVNLNSIIAAIHPDDIHFVAKAEQASLDYLYKKLGQGKALKYKMNY